MRLALDIRTLIDSEPGGVAAYTRALARALQEIPEIECATITAGRSLGSIDQSDFPGLRRIALPNPLLNLSLKTTGLPRLDWFTGASHYLLPNWNFVALSRKTELTLVVHDLSFERNPRWYSPKQRFWHQAVGPRELCRRADRLIAVSNWTKRELISIYGAAEDKISVIYPIADELQTELPFPAALPERFILFLGAVEERKNPLSLLSAFERIADKHPETHLIIAGKRGYGSRRLLLSARRSRVAQRIHLLSYVPRAVRHSLYRQASVFAYPSFYEGFGIPLLEAMAAGLPVVAGYSSAMPEVLGGAGLLVDPKDVSQIALALDEILTSRSLAATLSARALSRAASFPVSLAGPLSEFYLQGKRQVSQLPLP